MKKLPIVLIIISSIILLCIASGVIYGKASENEEAFRMDKKTLVEYSGREETVTIPNGVEVIGTEAFMDNDKLKKVILPSSLKVISYSSFCNCKNLESVSIPDSVQTIDSSAFANCENMTEFSLGAKVSKLGSGILAGCTSLDKISVNSKNEYFSYQNGALYSADKTKLYQLLAGRKENYYVMNSNVEKVEQYAFYGCENLQYVTVSNVLPAIDDYAFSNCKSLKSITLSYAVKRIGMKAFEDCASLEQIYVPNSVSNIHETAFDGCYKVQFLAEDGFYAAKYADAHDINVLNRPKYETDVAETLAMNATKTEESSELLTIATKTQEEVNAIEEQEGELLGSTNVVATQAFVLMDSSKQKVITGASDSAENQILNKTVDKRIEDYAFYQNSEFENVTIPQGVESIGKLSFARSNMKSLTIPDTVQSISYGAFYHCDQLQNISISPNVQYIDQKVFDNTPWLDSWYKNAEEDYLVVGDGILLAYKCADEDFVLPENVKTIACDIPKQEQEP